MRIMKENCLKQDEEDKVSWAITKQNTDKGCPLASIGHAALAHGRRLQEKTCQGDPFVIAL